MHGEYLQAGFGLFKKTEKNRLGSETSKPACKVKLSNRKLAEQTGGETGGFEQAPPERKPVG